MTVTPGRGYGETTDEIGFSGQLDWDIGGMNLTSITAVRDWKRRARPGRRFHLGRHRLS
jgi:iron complex outermembrane receptor protein